MAYQVCKQCVSNQGIQVILLRATRNNRVVRRHNAKVSARSKERAVVGSPGEELTRGVDSRRTVCMRAGRCSYDKHNILYCFLPMKSL